MRTGWDRAPNWCGPAGTGRRGSGTGADRLGPGAQLVRTGWDQAPRAVFRSCNRASVITRLMDKLPSPGAPLRRRRVPLISILIASGALLVAACGSSPNNAAVANLGTTTTTNAAGSQGVSPPATSNSSGPSGGPQANSSGPGGGGGAAQAIFGIPGGNAKDALAFSECMRSHGVPNFPDPNAQGGIRATGLDPGSSTFQAATKDCRHLLPNGGQPTPAEQAAAMAQALKMSECMRSHGITAFPDPVSVPGGGIQISLHSTPGSNLNPNNSQFQAAQKACQRFSPGGAPG